MREPKELYFDLCEQFIDTKERSDIVEMAMREYSSDLSNEIERLKEEVRKLTDKNIRLEDKIDEWKDSTDLIGSSGDPSDIEPKHNLENILNLDKRIAELERKEEDVRQEIRQWLASEGFEGLAERL